MRETISHFACNFAKCSPILKILLPADWIINVQESNLSHLKCLAILPCDLSLITIHISDWRNFSDIHISQGSVATCLRLSGIFKHVFVANLLPSPSVKKKFENRLISVEVIGKSLVSCFFDSHCRMRLQTRMFSYCSPGGDTIRAAIEQKVQSEN